MTKAKRSPAPGRVFNAFVEIEVWQHYRNIFRNPDRSCPYYARGYQDTPPLPPDRVIEHDLEMLESWWISHVGAIREYLLQSVHLEVCTLQEISDWWSLLRDRGRSEGSNWILPGAWSLHRLSQLPSMAPIPHLSIFCAMLTRTMRALKPSRKPIKGCVGMGDGALITPGWIGWSTRLEDDPELFTNLLPLIRTGFMHQYSDFILPMTR